LHICRRLQGHRRDRCRCVAYVRHTGHHVWPASSPPSSKESTSSPSASTAGERLWPHSRECSASGRNWSPPPTKRSWPKGPGPPAVQRS